MAGARGGQAGPAGAHYYVAVGAEEDKLPTLVDLLQAMGARGGAVAVAVVCGSRAALDFCLRGLREAAPGEAPEAAAYVLHADMRPGEIEAAADEFARHADRARAEARAQTRGCSPTRLAALPGGPGRGQGTAMPEAGAPGGSAPGGGGAVPLWLNRSGAGAGLSAAGIDAGRAGVCLLVATEACLLSLDRARGAPRARAPLLINYDPPARRDAYLRRLDSVVGPQGPVTTAAAGDAGGGGPSPPPPPGSTPPWAVTVTFVTAQQVGGGSLQTIEAAAGAAAREMPLDVSVLVAECMRGGGTAGAAIGNKAAAPATRQE